MNLLNRQFSFGDQLKIEIAANPFDSIVIKELLSPWNVTFTAEGDADVSIVFRQSPKAEEHSVIIPSDTENFKTLSKRNHFETSIKTGCLVSVPATAYASLSIKPEKMYFFSSPTIFFNENNSTYAEVQEDMLVLKINIVDEFYSILKSTLEPAESRLHRLATSMPIPYGLAPKRIRDLLMKSHDLPEELTLCDKLPMDALRLSLVSAIEKASNKVLEKKPIFCDNYICVLTHDIDTASGLQRARIIKKTEERYDARSAWYIPSKRYKLNEDIIKELSNSGEIGVHDTKHDGKLAHLPKEKLVTRFSDAKQSLGKIVDHKIDGFRAPVLQHNPTILQALTESGFVYDTSIPTWEPKHPFTMKSHGIGTIYPITLNGIIEIPLTLPQDHQLLHVLGLTPEEVMRTWATMASLIRDLGGICMFLVHPDYKFGDMYSTMYEEIVNTVTSDRKATVTLPSRLCGLIKEYQTNESCLERFAQ